MKKHLVALYSPEKDKYVKQKSEQWRPTLKLLKEFKPDSATIIYQKKHNNSGAVTRFQKELPKEINTKIRLKEIVYNDPYNIIDVAKTLSLFLDEELRKYSDCDIYIHTTVGTGAMRTVLYNFIRENSKRVKEILSWEEKDRKYRINDFSKNIKKKYNSRFSKEDLISILEVPGGSLLITGETGTGKTFLAEKISDELFKNSNYENSIIAVNCAQFASNSELAQSELFGHVKGTFTGADKDKDGYLQKADGKILFLDEIGELDLLTQALLLKALDSGEFHRLGSTDVSTSSFRIISGTNKNLFDEIEKGTFREDLLHRISLVHHHLPPLRNLPGYKWDNTIKTLLDTIKKTDLKESIKVSVDFNEDAYIKYLNFAKSGEAVWKGNYRDLKDSLKRLILLSEKENITTKNVEREIEELKYRWNQFSNGKKFKNIECYLGKECDDIDYIDKVYLEEYLNVCKKSRTMKEAGEILYNKSKRGNTNYSDKVKKYLEKYDLTFNVIN